MTKNSFSPDYLESAAKTLAFSLERNNIFPPLLNDSNIILQNKRPLHKRKRPPNAFFICRMNVQNEVKRIECSSSKYNMRIISKAASILWNDASFEEKYQYFTIANTVKELYRKSMLTDVENSYSHYYNFQLSSQSHAIIIEEDISVYLQSISYIGNLLIINNEMFFNEL